MATTAERQVWAVLAGMALLGAGVRWVGVRRLEAALLAAQPAATGGRGAHSALLRQQAAVDSARQASPPARRRSRSGRPPAAPTGIGPDTSTPARPGGILKEAAVDVNSATVTELERLPRIGPALAQRIVAWREAHGPFQGPEELHHVRGIGPAIARQLSGFVTFSSRRRPFSREASASTPDVPPPA